MKYIDCKSIAQKILDDVKNRVETADPGTFGKLCIISAGEDPASQSYIRGKIKDCEYCGIPYEHIKLGSDWRSCIELSSLICGKDKDPSVDGIIVQLPLPSEFGEDNFYTDMISPHKDVDGFTGDSYYRPCTAEGILEVITSQLGDITGMNALIIGRGKTSGKPTANILLEHNCTVTVAHSKTKDLDSLLPNYDIIVSCVGKRGLVDLKKCSNAKIVVDVGITRDENGKLCGDCTGFDPDDGSDLLVTPVPGGIGLMTRAMLMRHMVG